MQHPSFVGDIALGVRTWSGILGSVPLSWPPSLFLLTLQGAPHKPRALSYPFSLLMTKAPDLVVHDDISFQEDG